MNTFAKDVNIINEDLSLTIPHSSVITRSNGTCVNTAICSASEDKPNILVRFSGTVVHTTGAAAVAACLFIDDKNYPEKTVPINVKEAGFFEPLYLEFAYEPGDFLPHTYRIHVGAHVGAVRMNGGTTGPLYDNTMSSVLIVEAK